MATQAKSMFDDVAPWPAQPAPAKAEIGHNKPPVEDEAKAAFRDALLADRPDFEQKVNDIEAGAKRVVVSDDESYGRAGSMLNIIRAATKHVDEAHAAAKLPYLTGGRVVDAEKKALVTRLEAARATVQAQANDYAAKKAAEERAERERIAAEQRAAAEAAARAERERQLAEEEAARAAAEATTAEERAAAEQRAAEAARAAEEAMAAAALAPAPAARAEPVRADDGASISAKTVWNSQVEDYAKAFKAVKSDPKVKEAIDAAVARLVRAGQRELSGVRIWPTQQAVAR